MVGTTGIEPVTTAMSRQYSTAELRAPIDLNLMSNQQGRARYHMRGALLNDNESSVKKDGVTH